MTMLWQDARAFYFVWPWALLLLLLIPIGWSLYLRDQRKKLETLALSFSYTALVSQLKKQPTRWKRLLAPSATSLLCALLILILARPTLVARVPVNTVDMMLVLDISLSMMADDIRPNRLTAAKEAAIRFVKSLPRDTRIGLELFAGDNYVLSPPTTRHGEIIEYLRALDKKDLKLRTKIGSALHTALEVLKKSDRLPAQAANKEQQTTRKPEKAVILLSDGDSHEGYPWDMAARDAKKLNIITYTVGVGSAQGGVITYQGIELPVNFNETILRSIAKITGGEYFRVFRESDFRRVYERIRERTLHYEERDLDLSFLFAGFGLFILLLAFLLNRRVSPLP